LDIDGIFSRQWIMRFDKIVEVGEENFIKIMLNFLVTFLKRWRGSENMIPTQKS
jgi:hypothetical protein